MKVVAQLKYLRMSPRKVRAVGNLVRGLDVADAEKQLSFLPKHAASPLRKLLQSATANAEHNFNLKREGLYIRSLIVEGGPVLKRFLPRMGGRASDIKKRTSHIILTLEARNGGEERKPKKRKATLPLSSEHMVEPAGGMPTKIEGTPVLNGQADDSDIKTRKKKFRAPKREEILQKTPRFMKRIFRRKSI